MSAISAAFVALALSCSLPAFALAQDLVGHPSAAACSEFSWPVDRERAWFNQSRLPHRSSGARLRKIDRAVSLDLKPTSKVKFFLPPDRKPGEDSYSGEVAFFGVPKPGLYQVTVSDAASIDVFENGTRLKEVASTGAKDCPGVAESVRVDLTPGSLVLVEITGSSAPTIKAAFSEAR